MIPSNELRIGNWVEQVIESDCGKYSIITAVGLITSDDIDANPIPITPEILEKAGFSQYEHSINKLNENGDGIGFHLIDGKMSTSEGVTLFGYHDWIETNTQIKFVHQLQNLFFAVTGEELNIQL